MRKQKMPKKVDKIQRQEVQHRSPKERTKDFFEVSLGLTQQQAIKEAQRCIQCKNPTCIEGCPVEIDIPAFIKLIKEKKIKESLKKIKEKNNLPAICGRVCPQEDQCELTCVLNKKKIPINPVRNTKVLREISKISNGVNIGALERYASDFGEAQTENSAHPNKEQSVKVAVVGSGPAGLTAAADLAKMGYAVTLFESLHLSGGVLSYGIPEFRLPKKIVHSELQYIESLGVHIQTNVLIGKTFTLEDLFNQGYKAIFLGVGAGLPMFLNIPGENSPGIYSANEFLTRINLMKAYQFPKVPTPIEVGDKVVVVGAGNVAFDCARCAIRLGKPRTTVSRGRESGVRGKDVTLVYRRSEVEMPAREDEVENAKQEGLIFKLLTQPKQIILDKAGRPSALKCLKMKLGEPDSSGRRRPVKISGSEFEIPVDTIVVAIGQRPNPLIYKSTSGLKVNPKGTIWVDESCMTSIAGVFAGGDITTGAATVISAMGAGKKAARAMDKYINDK